MRVRIGACIIAILAIAACGDDGGGQGDLSSISVVLRQGSAELQIQAEIAATVAERTRGLMSRPSLGPREGMFFLFRGPIRGSFHMKDTLIPLDIAFIRAGRVTEIFTMSPCSSDPCPVTMPAGSFESALEVNAGTFERAGISAGASVRVEGALPTPE
jgi:uncharacterized membrane protein (UPF0127 family)